MVSRETQEKSASVGAVLPDVFVRLFTRDQRHIYCYIRSLEPNPVDAEEIFQQTSLVLWEKFGQFEPGTHFCAWACKIARFEVFNHRASRNRVKPLFSEAFVREIAEEAEQNTEYLEARNQALRHCLEKLRRADQDLINLRYQPGGTSRAAARMLGRPIRSVYKSLSRIHKTLLKCIDLRLTREDRV